MGELSLYLQLVTSLTGLDSTREENILLFICGKVIESVKLDSMKQDILIKSLKISKSVLSRHVGSPTEIKMSLESISWSVQSQGFEFLDFEKS